MARLTVTTSASVFAAAMLLPALGSTIGSAIGSRLTRSVWGPIVGGVGGGVAMTGLVTVGTWMLYGGLEGAPGPGARPVGDVSGVSEVEFAGEPARVEVVDATPWGKARLLIRKSREDLYRADLRDLALALRSRLGRDPVGIASGVQRFVQGVVQYVREPVETFQSGPVTMRAGVGDCDDSARLTRGLVSLAGVPARLMFLARGGDPVHAVAQARVADRWRWLETTIPARYDEHPIAAARRLREVRW